MIHYRNRVRGSGVDTRALKRAAQAMLDAVGESGSSLSVTLAGDGAVRALNRAYRGKDRATDVLSFPLVEGADTLPPAAPRGVRAKAAEQPERMLGDVVISVDTARRQAADYDAPLQSEIYRLLIHGVLHVLGHDHELPEERARMEREERRLAAAIGIPWPYEAR